MLRRRRAFAHRTPCVKAREPRFLILTSCTATNYLADDPTCTPHLIPAESSLFEPAGEVHNLRNEQSEPLVYVTVALVATGHHGGSTSRIPATAPEGCQNSDSALNRGFGTLHHGGGRGNLS